MEMGRKIELTDETFDEKPSHTLALLMQNFHAQLRRWQIWIIRKI